MSPCQWTRLNTKLSKPLLLIPPLAEGVNNLFLTCKIFWMMIESWLLISSDCPQPALDTAQDDNKLGWNTTIKMFDDNNWPHSHVNKYCLRCGAQDYISLANKQNFLHFSKIWKCNWMFLNWCALITSCVVLWSSLWSKILALTAASEMRSLITFKILGISLFRT